MASASPETAPYVGTQRTGAFPPAWLETFAILPAAGAANYGRAAECGEKMGWILW